MKNTLSILLAFSLLVTICFSCFTLVSSAEDPSIEETSTKESTIVDSSIESEDESSIVEPVVTYGDVNADGRIDMKDVLMIRKHMAYVELENFNEANADANGDGNIDMKDVLLVRKYMAHVIDHLGPTSTEEHYTYYEDGTIETKRVYDAHNFLIEFFQYDTDGILYSHTVYKNDSDGRCIEETVYHEDEEFFSWYIYEYADDGTIITTSKSIDGVTQWVTITDEEGKLLEERTYEDGELVTTAQYTYDENGNTETYKVYEKDVLVVNEFYVYDDEGNLIEEYEYDAQGDVITKYTYTYKTDDPNVDEYYAFNQFNAKGILIYSYVEETMESIHMSTNEYTSYTDDGIISLYEYDTYLEDQMVESIIRHYDDEGQLLYTEKIKYNDDGSVKECQITGSENYTIVYSYLDSGDIDVLTYKDVDGNIIKTETYNYDEETMECISYTIDYYENGIVVNSETIYLEENESSEDELQN